jgi:hypothetical protein
MTKTVRIENADSGTYFKLNVFVEAKQADGSWKRTSENPDAQLSYPCQMRELGIHDGTRLVIEEYHDTPPAVVVNAPI